MVFMQKFQVQAAAETGVVVVLVRLRQLSEQAL